MDRPTPLALCRVCNQPWNNQAIDGEPAGHFCLPKERERMSVYRIKWERLFEWMLHLQRKKLGLDEAPISPIRDTYTEGFNDAVDMVVRWMQAEEMGNEHEKA
jgi:hypothetical protein